MPTRPPRFRPPGNPRPPRASASERGYDSEWSRFRLTVLADRPVCEDCGRESSVDVDHVVSLARGGAKYDLANVRALCHPCHSRKTVKEDGGFGREAAGGD